MKKLLILIIIIASIMVIAGIYHFVSEAMLIHNMSNEIQVALETFEHSKSQLEIIRNGKFATECDYLHLDALKKDNIFIPRQEWNEMPWLPEEEKNALVYLVEDPDLPLHYTYIQCYEGQMRAVLFNEAKETIITIDYRITNPSYIYSEEISDGYYLNIYKTPPPPNWPFGW